MENYKILLKGIKEDLHKWKNFPWSWIRRLNIVKMVISSQINLQIQHKPYQNLRQLICRNWQTDSKMYVEMQGTKNSPKNLEEEKQVGEPTCPNFKTYYKGTIIKNVQDFPAGSG